MTSCHCALGTALFFAVLSVFSPWAMLPCAAWLFAAWAADVTHADE
jgi:hypothetical protein